MSSLTDTAPRSATILPELRQHLSHQHATDDLAIRLQWANDASIYHLLPAYIVIAQSAADIQHTLAVARRHQIAVCFRAGGTSLSGQAVTDGILVVISQAFRDIDVHADGARVRAGCGAIGSWVNAALAVHNKRIGPDPASIQAAEIGGIVANNASGMCCGVHENSYRTVTDIDLILASGFRFNTSDPRADEALEFEHPEIASGIIALRDELRADTQLAAQVATAFETKNTVGYSLNALLDADTPAAIIQKLLIGSEGTLGFICSAEFQCIDVAAYTSTALLLFPDVEAAGAAVAPLADSGAAAIELLDAVSLRRVHDKLPMSLPENSEHCAALLVEYHAPSADILHQRVHRASELCATFSLMSAADFSEDPQIQAQLWAVRKGLFPSVGAVRAANTAVVIEDITFPVEKLAIGVHALHELFAQYDYTDAVIFGHAKDGNLHFTLTPDFSQPQQVTRYSDFMDALAQRVLALGGHLKAEHGTGRNMAPYVSAQWGAPAVDLMRRIKKLLDPHNILNPGVLLSDDPQAHIRNLKTIPTVHEKIDSCIECGFCEPVCPSRDATFSPRQRIVMLRHGAQNPDYKKAVQKVWQHAGLDTCAADGMCATACPVNINTGDLVKAERLLRNGWVTRFLAQRIANNMSLVCRGTRFALAACRIIGVKRLPFRPVALPHQAPALPRTWAHSDTPACTIVYLPSCLSRSMHSRSGISAPSALMKLCAAATVNVIIPSNVSELCCGQPFTSKGHPDIARSMKERIADTLRSITQAHDHILAIDTSTCASQLESLRNDFPDWTILHPAAVASQILIPRLSTALKKRAEEVILHPTCAEHKHHWLGDLKTAGNSAAASTMPLASGCCGMAGDRGWLEPALTAAATAREGAEASSSAATTGACSNIACALAMEAASGKPYQHLWSLLAQQLDPTA